ncbi:MAG: HD domain-containing protein [Candidatus Zeuxoniibacter abyssi]|nr:MAG: HD domain-containing protein [Candidatus Persebacteraceae bacterium AB1(2)]
MKPTQENMTQFIRWLFEKRGTESYLGEKVTMAEHMLQAAYFAGQDGATEKLIVAALLHDVGHFIGDFGDDFIEMGVNNLHEDAGGKVLSPFFPAEVTEPIRLHVAAKNICVQPILLITLAYRKHPSAPWSYKAAQ